MTGIDTSWLVDLEVRESPRHEGALNLFEGWRAERTSPLCIYHHVFLEFLHVVTDPNRFERPLAMEQALERVWFWTGQERIRVVYPEEKAFQRCLLWLSAWRLGRKRLLDTQMAAAYAEAGVTTLWTANPADFTALKVFKLPAY